jgi:hypothetical protein
MTSTKHFARHYIEMVVVMFAGMGVLALPTGWVLEGLGSSWSALGDAQMLAVMAGTMVGPMVAWMALRGHTWRANGEMAASMVLPTVAVLALLWAGVLTDLGALMVLEHVAMLASMLAAMLLRRDEYAHAVAA